MTSKAFVFIDGLEKNPIACGVTEVDGCTFAELQNVIDITIAQYLQAI